MQVLCSGFADWRIFSRSRSWCLTRLSHRQRRANLWGFRWRIHGSFDTSRLDVEPERTAFSCLTVNSHLTSLKLNQLPADEQTETTASIAFVSLWRSLTEALEQVLRLGLSKTTARVLHAEGQEHFYPGSSLSYRHRSRFPARLDERDVAAIGSGSYP